MKILSYVFQAVAVLLSDVMCAVVAYQYCTIQWGIKYDMYSAPASTAFVFAVPFLAVIAVSVVLAVVFGRKARA